MVTKSPTRFRALMVLFLLLAACGLAGQFAIDALGGSYILTEHECQELQLAGSEVLHDCCCTHSGFTLLGLLTVVGLSSLGFWTSLAQPHRASVALGPPFHPPNLSLKSF